MADVYSNKTTSQTLSLQTNPEATKSHTIMLPTCSLLTKKDI